MQEALIQTVINSLRPASISVSCLLVVVSLLMLFIGFICGQCFNQRHHRKLTQQEESATAAASERLEDLELNENVAYVTIHLK